MLKLLVDVGLYRMFNMSQDLTLGARGKCRDLTPALSERLDPSAFGDLTPAFSDPSVFCMTPAFSAAFSGPQRFLQRLRLDPSVFGHLKAYLLEDARQC